MITLIHEIPWQILIERLDAMVTSDPGLAPARALVKAPVALLAALGEDVEAALSDDQLALERVRALLSVSAVHAQPFSSMRALIAGPSTGPGTTTAMTSTRDPLNDPCATSIVDAGGVVLAGLAAARAGAEVGLPDAFVDHALALVLAATPAEALSRAIAAGLTDSQLRAVMAALVPADSGDRHLSMALASFIADPCERARWRALDSLFALVRQGQPVVWEGATSEGITAVAPRSACEGGTVEIRVRLQPHAATSAPPHVAGLLADLAKGSASVVFASTTGPAVAAPAKSVNQQIGLIRVVLPAGTRAGWVGVTSPTLVAESNRSRQQLRAFWQTQNAQHAALRQAPVPVDAIAPLPAIPAPPRTAGSRFDGGLPGIELLAIEPGVVDANSVASLRWRVVGADRVTIDRIGAVPASGVAKLDVPHGESTVSARLTADNTCGEATARAEARVRVRIADLQVRLSGSDQPPHEGAPAAVTARLSSVPKGVRARLFVGSDELAMRRDHDVISAEVPAATVTRQLAGRVRVFVDRSLDDEQSFGPVSVAAPGRRRVVIVRPVMLSPTFGRVSIAEAAEAVQQAARAIGVEIDAVMAPWIEHAGFAFDGVAGGPGTPATRRLLERLNTLSAETTGLEDAVWVALVPGGDARIAVACPGDAAAAIAVASRSALAEVLRQPPQLAEPATDRLCLMGTVDRLGAVRIADLRRRRRPIGAGASIETGLKVFGVDRVGRDVCSVPVRLHSDVLPASFVALLPMAPDIARIEIRVVDVSDVIDTALFQPDPAAEDRWVARRIERVVGEPALSDVRVSRGMVQWQYAHGRGVRPTVAIELGRDGGWWPIHRADGCASRAGLMLDRLSPTKEDVVRVVASDGWNTVASSPVRPPSVRAKRVVAHYAGDGRFWADFGDTGGEPAWRIGRTVRKGPVVAVPPGYRGSIQLMVNTGRRVITDERLIDLHGGVDGSSLA